jgi:Zn-dependent peptidase ImmA (M78 family)/transcriptional regulator with XRE-family HTH domain
MRGTPGFVGERLKEAREARGLTAIALADLLNITKQAISLYELGDVSPQPDMMQEIAYKLNLPIAFFLRPIKYGSSSAVFFRALCAANKSDRGRGRSRMRWLYEVIVPYLMGFVTFPKVNIPEVGTISNPLRLTDDDIENIATQVRRYWGLGDGPISNVVLLMENNGFIITRMDLESPALDAFSNLPMSFDNTPYIILGNDKQSSVRSRFDAGHELGHLILHRSIKDSDLNKATDFKIIEQQANRFSSAFLVPMNKFSEDFSLPTLNAFRALKSKWLVSVALLIKRAYDLGFIPDEHYRRLWIYYNHKGWRKEEPLDSELPIEQPLLLRRAFASIIEAKVRTPEQLLSELPLSSKDVEGLIHLPEGYFDPSAPEIGLKFAPLSNTDGKSAVEEAERIIKGE